MFIARGQIFMRHSSEGRESASYPELPLMGRPMSQSRRGLKA